MPIELTPATQVRLSRLAERHGCDVGQVIEDCVRAVYDLIIMTDNKVRVVAIVGARDGPLNSTNCGRMEELRFETVEEPPRRR